MSRLDGKVAVILGAYNEGRMGTATARRIKQEGARLVLAARRLEEVEAIAAPLGAIAMSCDVTREVDVAALFERALSEFGKLDVAINYSGANVQSFVVDISEGDLNLLCSAQFFGAALFIEHAALWMWQGGSIITTSSLKARVAPAGLAAYAGTKAGMDQYVRIAANELGADDIRVDSMMPGFTRSAMTEAYFGIPTLEAAFIREIPLGRLSRVEDVANAASCWRRTRPLPPQARSTIVLPVRPSGERQPTTS